MSRLIAPLLILASFTLLAAEDPPKPAARPIKVAGITTEYRFNSHAEMLLGRILETETLDGKGQRSSLQLVSLFTDQVPKNDLSRAVAKKHGVPIHDSVRGALTLGGDRLAVDGVLLVAEHGQYPRSETGQIVYPKRRLFEEVFAEFDRSKRVVPVFSDKHLADNWADAKWVYDGAKKRNVPLMAGSSIPSSHRHPPTDVKRGAKLKQIVGVSYGSLDAYGFHGLEMIQSLAERRAGGETGVKRVWCVTGQEVWAAGKDGVYDPKLLDAALARLGNKGVARNKTREQAVKQPVLFVADYADGLRACLFTLNGIVGEWAAAWKYGDDTTDATVFWNQEDRPFVHFWHQLRGVEAMMRTGKPTWPVERTLLASGVLDAALISKKDGGKVVETPYMEDVKYESTWDWAQPPPPPPTTPRVRK